MSVDLTVARAGEDYTVGLGEDVSAPYRDLPKIELTASEDDRLGDVMDRAAELHGIALPGNTIWGHIYSVAFSRGENSTVWGRLDTEVALIDAEGHLRWTYWWHLEPVSEYLRAGEAGALDGDPRRPILLVHPPVGNGVLADFPSLLELWTVIWDVLGRLETLGGLYATKKLVIDRLRDRYRRARTVTENHLEEWKAKGARPDNLVKWLGAAPRGSDDVGHLLGCSTEEAEALMLGLGFARDGEGLWRAGADGEAKLIVGNTELIIHAPDLVREEVARLVRERVDQLLEQGSAPEAPDWQTIGELPRDPQYDYERDQPPEAEAKSEEMERAIEEARSRRRE